ncbi:MAG: 50S ribosomal protein L11 methyltransferase [Gammaproteobacteria bacterium]|nr:50S ribosomal protein L11 methyltransferase [Gammaproteobacteria bacterium]
MTTQAWRKLRFNARDFEVAGIESVLEAAGALAITIEARDAVPVFDTLDQNSPILWPLCAVEALFESEIEPEEIVNRVGGAGFSIFEVKIEWVADRAWHLAWRDQFKPLCFADRLWVVPSWHSAPANAELMIILDPGMAFGTGSHATTGLCLEWLVTEAGVQSQRVLDYGCGSGILAIAATKLGADAVAAVDIDPEAWRVAHENAQLNKCMAIAIGGPETLGQATFDIVVANLLLRPLLELQAEFVARLNPHGRIGLSGILCDQVNAVLEAYADAFKMNPPVLQGEWALITGTRRT